ncbi:acyl-CoA dehydrogenase family protein [Parafrigoribacterium mesophilum]|uniref:acyl-CoA dehydrogenase family protein n=1 Tax=Parafrigoribacterium mesophilum TaxID=433646 RepID=UPI0031FE066D
MRRFIDTEVIPLELEVLSREAAGEIGLPRPRLRRLQATARRQGLWGLATPEEYGGLGLGPVLLSVIHSELGRTFVPFDFGGKADNILFSATAEQKRDYLLPTIAGERVSCFAITEPGAGSDAAGVQTTARRDGDSWLINGEKKFRARA